MKLLFDQHLSPILARHFATDFPGSAHAMDLGLDRADDLRIWIHAREHAFVIVTKDGDYHDLGMRHGFPPYVVLIRRGNCPTKIIKAIIEQNKDNIQTFVKSDQSGMLILF